MFPLPDIRIPLADSVLFPDIMCQLEKPFFGVFRAKGNVFAAVEFDSLPEQVKGRLIGIFLLSHGGNVISPRSLLQSLYADWS